MDGLGLGSIKDDLLEFALYLAMFSPGLVSFILLTLCVYWPDVFGSPEERGALIVTAFFVAIIGFWVVLFSVLFWPTIRKKRFKHRLN